MIEFYAEVRLVHIWAVIASGSLFALRGLALNLGACWPKAAPLRYLSYTIDTVLLTAALVLMTVVQQYPFVDAWLTVKVLLLVVYIAIGVYAFRTRRSAAVRWAAWLAALAVFGFIVSVARTREPLGVLAALG